MFNRLMNLFGKGISVDFKKLVDDGALIIDVRSSQEFRGGHIKNAINIPLDEIRDKLNELKKKNKVIITCCRSGNRSGMAKSILQTAGLECYNGGAWNVLDHQIQ